jgi:uroporphyrinogen-III synthase
MRKKGAPMRHVLILRPLPQAEQTAQSLRERGYEPVLSPVMRIDILPFELPERRDANTALIITSAQVWPALEAQCDEETLHFLRSLPLYCVGDNTAQLLQAKGFHVAHSAPQASNLVALMQKQYKEKGHRAQKALYLAGYYRKSDLENVLRQAGWDIEICEVYAARAATRLLPEAVDLLHCQAVNCILFTSSRQVEIFVSLCEKAGVLKQAQQCKALCLSPAISHLAGQKGFSAIQTAPYPDMDSLLQQLA